MIRGSGKLGRGGGNAGKRIMHTPPMKRHSPGANVGRLSLGGNSRGRGGATSSAVIGLSTSPPQVEENFSLVRENSLNFAMAIKLAPELVEEIKRVEAQGGVALIKFAANPNHANGNVISVGNKNFKFTWARETPVLCDIYEERQCGDDGNGLLVESGSAWRKLSVERVLDESTQNHVKMMSEEAERKLKSRKAIILDHQNLSVKNQGKALTAVESGTRRNFKNKKEPPSRMLKSESTPVVPPKPVYKSGLSATPSRGKPYSVSPLSSQADQYGTPASPFGIVKGNVSVPDIAPSQNMNKAAISDKEVPSRMPNNTTNNSKHNHVTEVKPSDLRSLMISLLQEHHLKGISLKALEKAIRDSMPNADLKIEPILKQIANFQAPGRYFLKPAVGMESFKEPPSERGSSPRISHHRSPAPQKFDEPSAEAPSFSMRTVVNDEEQAQLKSTHEHELDTDEIVDILHDSPDHFSDKRISDNNEGVAGNSSGNNSESDSESDSGSDKSRGGSSSDSESDSASSSKQASDEDVDIMISDDSESKHMLRDSERASLKSPVQSRDPDSETIDIGNYEQDNHVSDFVEIEKDSPENHEPVEEIKQYSVDYHEQIERQGYGRKSYGGQDSEFNNGFKPSQSGSHENSSKSKRRSDDKHSDDRAHNSKRLKSKNPSVSGTINLLFGESANDISPDRPLQSPFIVPIDQIINDATREVTTDPSPQTGYNQVIHSQQPGQRSLETSRRCEASSGEKWPGKHDSTVRDVKYSERSIQCNEGIQTKKGLNMVSDSENGLASERRLNKFYRESSGDKHATSTESYRKPEKLVTVKEAGPHSTSYTGYSPKENTTAERYQMMNGRGPILRREISDLELGEFREPLNDENSGPKNQFERKNSFKQFQNGPSDQEHMDSESSRGKTAINSGKWSSPDSEAVASGIPDRSSKRKVPEHSGDDHASTSKRANWRENHIEVVSQHNKVLETSSKNRYDEAGTGQDASFGAFGENSKKVPVNATEQQHDLVQKVVLRSTKESKKQKPNKVGDSNRQKDSSLKVSNDGGQKTREFSSDANSCSYTKYEKDVPELKGPIKDLSQYKEYVKEYQEKYESYCSLNKILESYRDEFSNFGKDLEAYRGRDMKKYHDIVGQMRSSFRQCGKKHKRLKKIFVVLYEELKQLKQMIKDFAGSYAKD